MCCDVPTNQQTSRPSGTLANFAENGLLCFHHPSRHALGVDGDASQLPPTTALHFQAPRAFVGLGDCTGGFASALPTSQRVGEKATVFESFELLPGEGGPLLALYHLACDQHSLVVAAQKSGGNLVLRGLLSTLWFRGLFSHRILHHVHHLLSTQQCWLDVLLESPSRDREMVDPLHIAL